MGKRTGAKARHRAPCRLTCRETAARSEVHHITDWANGGTTDTDKLALACDHHNNEAPRQDRYAIMLHGVPHWVPPNAVQLCGGLE